MPIDQTPSRPMLATVIAGSIALLGGCADREPEAAPARTAAPETAAAPSAAPSAGTSSAAGLAAFDTVYEVLQHPRCLNCHPAGDRPLQSDDSRPHVMNVQRGPDDRGRAGMHCITCHGTGNFGAPLLPPGVSTEWRLAPREMVFEGESKRDLARMLLDPKRSHMTTEEMIEHVSHDALVLWGWNPGPGRTPVPVAHDDFVEAFVTWIEAGAPVPEEEASP